MFNMSQNKFNNGNQLSVNTRLYSSYSDTCMLSIGAWNEQLSIRFAPIKSIDENGVRQYAQDRMDIITTSLTVDNALTLLDGINKVILPALEKKEAGDVAVTMGTDTNRKIMSVKTDGKDVYLVLYLSVNAEGIAGGDSISHKFNKREYYVNYNPTEGAKNVVSVEGDFLNFVEKISLAKSMNQIVPHNINYGNALKSSYSKPAEGFGNQSNMGYNSAPITNVSNVDDFVAFGG